jgi:hypothetical protein
MTLDILIKTLIAIRDSESKSLKCVVQTSPIKARFRPEFEVAVFSKGFYGQQRELVIVPHSQKIEELCPYCGTKLRNKKRDVCKNCVRAIKDERSK